MSAETQTEAREAETKARIDAYDWELADYARTVGNLRADLTRAQLQASLLLEALQPFALAFGIAEGPVLSHGEWVAMRNAVDIQDFRFAAEAVATVSALTSGEAR